MAPNVQDIGRRMIVWLIAVVVGLQTSGAAVVELAYGRTAGALIWAVFTVLVFTVALQAERVKGFREEY